MREDGRRPNADCAETSAASAEISARLRCAACRPAVFRASSSRHARCEQVSAACKASAATIYQAVLPGRCDGGSPW